MHLLPILCAVNLAQALQIPFPLQSPHQAASGSSCKHEIIPRRTRAYVSSLLDTWSSPGLALAAVRLCSPLLSKTCPEAGYHAEFASFGVARVESFYDGTTTVTKPVTPDSVFSIASNSKLILAISVGLLISNDSLAWRTEHGEKLDWQSKAQDVFGKDVWQLWQGHFGEVTIQDMLSHRTGLPRHDYSTQRKGGIREMVRLMHILFRLTKHNLTPSPPPVPDHPLPEPPALCSPPLNLPIQQPDVRSARLPPYSPPQPVV
jgi:Beta-lactamase